MTDTAKIKVTILSHKDIKKKMEWQKYVRHCGEITNYSQARK